MIALLEAPLSFVSTRRLSRPGLSRSRFEELQGRALQKWLAHSVPRVTAFGYPPARLADLPVMDKAQLMERFDDYNAAGLSADQVRNAMARDFRVGSLTVGASTGTSGNRGLFVISDAERFRWLGSILAKTIGDLLWRRQRVAVILPQGTGLYSSANQIRQVQMQFFDLKDGPAAWRDRLEVFKPTVVVAPPKVLRYMAEQAFDLQPVRVFSAAETLDPIDRPVIEAAFGAPLEQIYMATEGLLGVTCRHGNLHLAEDSVFFEFEPAGNGLVTPLISSFRRDTQILARYRMNDLLRLAAGSCPCGSPLRQVAEVVGRMDDCFILPGPSGPELVTPDILRNAVLVSDPRITDFRLVQTGARDITLSLPTSLSSEVAHAAQRQLHHLLQDRSLSAVVTLNRTPFELDVSRKLRRVERRYPIGGGK